MEIASVYITDELEEGYPNSEEERDVDEFQAEP